MAILGRLVALISPTPIAIHDDRQMIWSRWIRHKISLNCFDIRFFARQHTINFTDKIIGKFLNFSL